MSPIKKCRENRNGVSFVAAAAVALALSGCGGGSDDAGDGSKITFGTAGVVQTPAQSMYTSLPEVLGYYKDEGLSVKRLDFEGAAAAAQALDAGKIDMAHFSTPPLFNISAAEGRSKLIAVATNITAPFSAPAVVEGSGIETGSDFEDKTVGVASLEHSQVPIIKAMCEQAGCDPDSITFVPVGQGAESVSALKSKRIDVLALFDAAYAEVENLGVKLRLIKSDLLDPLKVGFAATLNVQTDDLKDPVKREAFVKVARAQAKAMAFADENPEAAVRLHWEMFPESKPTGVSDAAALERGVRTLESRAANMQPVEGTWGLATDGQIEGAMKLQILAGELKEPADIDKVWTTDLLDEINDFDEDAVRKAAREWKP